MGELSKCLLKKQNTQMQRFCVWSILFLNGVKRKKKYTTVNRRIEGAIQACTSMRHGTISKKYFIKNGINDCWQTGVATVRWYNNSE